MALDIGTSNMAHERLDRMLIDTTRAVLEKTLSVLGMRSATIYDGNFSYVQPPNYKERFYILLRSRAHQRHEHGLPVPQTLFGFPCNLRDTSGNALFEPSGNGYVISDPESGYILAEIIGNNLYILFNLLDDRAISARNIAGIYRRILEETNVLLGGSMPSLADLQTSGYAIPKQSVLDAIEADAKALSKNAEQHVRAVLELERSRTKLVATTDTSSSVLNRIADIPEVKSVEMKDGKLVVNTHRMYGVHPTSNELHEYGEFRITFTFGRYGNASFRNTTRRPNGFGHPHVDRDGGYWCQGEGAGILNLLASYEFEAGVLFALKAIDSVNPDWQYLQVLNYFPRAESRMEYPKERAKPGAATHESFVNLFRQTLAGQEQNIIRDIGTAQKAIIEDQKMILTAAFVETLKLGPKKVSAKMKAQLKKTRALPDVTSVRAEKDVLLIETKSIESVESGTGTRHLLGPFLILFNFETGATTVENTKPLRLPDGAVLQAPHIPAKDGTLPIGQLSLTLPELLGTLELETAVSIVLDFLKQFDGANANKNALALTKKAA